MADAGELTVVLITHKFREVRQFATDVAVLRGGRLVGQLDSADVSETQLAAMMFDRFDPGAAAGAASASPELEYLLRLGASGRPAYLSEYL